MSKNKDDEYKDEFAKQTLVTDLSLFISPRGSNVEEQKQLEVELGKWTKRTTLVHKKRLAKAFESLAKETGKTRSGDEK